MLGWFWYLRMAEEYDLHLCSNDLLSFQEHGDLSPLRDY